MPRTQPLMQLCIRPHLPRARPLERWVLPDHLTRARRQWSEAMSPVDMSSSLSASLKRFVKRLELSGTS